MDGGARGAWTFQGHLDGKPPVIRAIMEATQNYNPKKNYVGYRTTQNIVCMEPQQKKVLLFVKLDPKRNPGPKGLSRDMSEVGHFGTGDLQITVTSLEELELAKPFLKKACEEVGG